MWVESMGVASGCGCKEVYRFPHKSYYCLVYSILIYLFIHICAYMHTQASTCTHTLPVLRYPGRETVYSISTVMR